MTVTDPAPTDAHLDELYRDLHARPERSFAEIRTAFLVARRLRALGWTTTTGVGGTGVVGVLRRGAGPVVALRADMDALDVPVVHACGHDVHVTCLLGAAAELAEDRHGWRGTALLVFQPVEAAGRGARAMVEDGLFERFGTPEVVLGQHLGRLPAGLVGLSAGPAFAAADLLQVTLHGPGAHASRPELSVDPVVMAAAAVLRLRGIVAREVAGTEAAVLTVRALPAGTGDGVAADRAELQVGVRTYDPAVRTRVLAAVDRVVRGEAAASGTPRPPEVELVESFPAVVNDPGGCARTARGFAADLGPGRVVDPGPSTGREDVGVIATAAGAPCVYWLLGGADPALSPGAADSVPDSVPVLRPTLRTGVAALVSAARTWLTGPSGRRALPDRALS